MLSSSACAATTDAHPNLSSSAAASRTCERSRPLVWAVQPWILLLTEKGSKAQSQQLGLPVPVLDFSGLVSESEDFGVVWLLARPETWTTWIFKVVIKSAASASSLRVAVAAELIMILKFHPSQRGCRIPWNTCQKN